VHPLARARAHPRLLAVFGNERFQTADPPQEALGLGQVGKDGLGRPLDLDLVLVPYQVRDFILRPWTSS
jgi:hypothetical protein